MINLFDIIGVRSAWLWKYFPVMLMPVLGFGSHNTTVVQQASTANTNAVTPPPTPPPPSTGTEATRALIRDVASHRGYETTVLSRPRDHLMAGTNSWYNTTPSPLFTPVPPPVYNNQSGTPSIPTIPTTPTGNNGGENPGATSGQPGGGTGTGISTNVLGGNFGGAASNDSPSTGGTSTLGGVIQNMGTFTIYPSGYGGFNDYSSTIYGGSGLYDPLGDSNLQDNVIDHASTKEY